MLTCPIGRKPNLPSLAPCSAVTSRRRFSGSPARNALPARRAASRLAIIPDGARGFAPDVGVRSGWALPAKACDAYAGTGNQRDLDLARPGVDAIPQPCVSRSTLTTSENLPKRHPHKLRRGLVQQFSMGRKKTPNHVLRLSFMYVRDAR